jgi:dimethylamine/trimethylamine dehydrogenase
MNAFTRGPIPGADGELPHVLTPEQVMVDGKRPPGERVVVYDGEGYFTAAGVAEKLALEGFRVELVTGLDQIAPLCDETLEGPLLRQRLHDVGVRMHPGVNLEAIQPGFVVASEFDERRELEADGVVLVTQRVSIESLYLELKAAEAALMAEGVEAIFRIGDCVAPRAIADAVFDGHRLAREIDSENPAVPLPYKREGLGLARV